MCWTARSPAAWESGRRGSRPARLGFAPRGTVHAFNNAGAAPRTVLVWSMGTSAMEKLLEELPQLPAGPPDMSKLMPILQRNDIEVVETG